jgi:hypothetical protein
VSEQESLLEQALELFVYAPAGIAISAAEELPQLIEKGRKLLGGQVETARMIGRFAVTTGQRRAGQVVGEAAGRLATHKVGGKPTGGSAAEKPPTTADKSAEGSSGAPGESTPARRATSGDGNALDPSTLAIPGYDSLSASQVVQRLAGLTTEELDQVRLYESATRRRKTILHRVAQLQTPPSP